MPAQSPLPQPGLIETLRWSPEEGYAHFEGHLARLASSSRALQHAHDAARARNLLDAAVAGKTTPQRVRLVQEADGALACTTAELPPMPADTMWKVAIADHRLDPANPLLIHKTTLRNFYDEARLKLHASTGADEALFLNTRDELCEGSITSLFVPRDGVLLTPPLACGLLAGVLRAELLASGKAREAVLKISDLAGEFCLGNSVRGLIRARLIEPRSRRPRACG